MKKRILSALLCFALFIAYLPVDAAAASRVVDVPISVNLSDATGVNLNIRLDPEWVETAEILSVSASAKGASYLGNQDGEKCKIAIASATPFSNSGTLLTLRLTVKAQTPADAELCKLLQVKVNEKITWQADNCILLSGVEDGGAYRKAVTIYYNEGSALLNGKIFTRGSTVSAEGEYTLMVTDKNGKTRTVRFAIDTTAPVITIAPYSTELSDQPLTVEASVNEGTLNAAAHTFTENGSFTFVATDAAGNQSTKIVTVSHLYKTYSVSLHNTPDKLQVTEGMKIDFSGWQLTINYDNGAQRTIPVTEDMLCYSTDTVGRTTGTVTYGTAAAQFAFTVVEKQLVSIAVTKEPDTMYYIEGTSFDSTGMELTLYYNNDTSAIIKTGWKAEYDFGTTGWKTVRISYDCKTTELKNVRVDTRLVTKITIVTLATKRSYIEGQEIDLTGMTLRVDYNDATNEILNTGWQVSGYDANKVGKQTITVSFGGKTATFTVEVKAKSLTGISVSKNPTKLTYVEGEKLDTTGLVIKATYNNGTSANVTGWTVSGYDANKVGKQTVTVTYGGKTATFTVTVEAAPKPTEPKPTEPKPTEPKPTEPAVPDSITSEKYPVKDGYIRKIAIGTTAGTLINGIREKLYVTVYDGKTVVKEDALVGTGMVVQLKDGDKVTDSVTVIVTGDVNGDGKITVTDMIATKSHLLGKSKFTGAAEKAADTNGDGKISITDFIQLKAHILGKSSVAPN